MKALMALSSLAINKASMTAASWRPSRNVSSRRSSSVDEMLDEMLWFVVE